jgi:hypothetical protein
MAAKITKSKGIGNSNLRVAAPAGSVRKKGSW